VCVGGGLAAGQPLERTLELAPSRVDLVISIDDLREFRESSLGASWAEVLTILYPRDGDARLAWGQLASMFGKDERTTFDALFGQRVTLMCEGIWDEEEPTRWMIVSRVGDGFEKRLVKGLKAAPREIVGGVAIHSLERGRFYLAPIVRDGGSEIVVCPRDSRELMMSFLEGEDRARIDSESIRTLQASDALVWVRGDDVDPWWGAGAVSFQRNMTSVDVLMHFENEQEIGERWDATSWAHRQDGDVARVTERAGDVLPISPSISPSGSFEKLFEEARSVPERSMILARAGEGGGSLDVGFGLVFEADDGLAFEIDRTTAGFLVWASRMLGLEDERHDFDGKYPDALRVVRMDENLRLPLVGDEPMSVMWKRVRGGEDREWWGWGMSPEVIGSLDPGDVEEGLVRGEMRDWLSVGSVAVSRLLGIAHESGFEAPKRVRPLTLLESVDWWLWLEDAHTARGTLLLEMLLFDGDAGELE
jgi:hypothetical protein